MYPNQKLHSLCNTLQRINLGPYFKYTNIAPTSEFVLPAHIEVEKLHYTLQQ